MSLEKIHKNQKGFEMYFVPEVAEKFAELEQNEKNFNTKYKPLCIKVI